MKQIHHAITARTRLCAAYPKTSMHQESAFMTHAEINALINEYLRPATFPVAIKLTQDPLPEKMKPVQELYGHRLAVCQGMTIARRIGRVSAFEPDDHICPVFHYLFGFMDVPDLVKNGEIVHPFYARNLECGQRTAALEYVLPRNSVENIILAPLHKADFEPDILVVYGNAAQVIRMVQGSLFNEGGAVSSSFSGREACASSIGYVYGTGKCNVVIPGGGERIFAQTADDELCFSMPWGKVESVLEGVKATHDMGVARIPTPFMGVFAEPKFPKSYYKLNELRPKKFQGTAD